MTARSGGRGGKRLSGEDRQLWDHLTRGLEPLARAKARVSGVEDVTGETGDDAPPARKGRAALRHAAPAELHRHDKPSPAPPAKRAAAPPIAEFDRKTAKRLRSGRREIEARIDLHGLRQADAHEALRRFLLRCHARDLRTVLVITGKGRPAGEAGDALAGYAREERGILKRNVPRWLDEADMRALVVSFTPAAARHGGDGALYIHLRRRPRLSD